MLQIINQLRLSRTDSDEISVIEAKQGDNQGDICQIEIYDNQDIVDLSQFDDILFTANKPDRSSVLFRLSDKKNLIKNNNTLSLTLTSTLLSVHGTVECEVSLYKGEILKSTYNFNIYVFKSPGSFDVMNDSDIITIKNVVSNITSSTLKAQESEKNAKQSEINAKKSEDSASVSANLASSKATEASNSATAAKISETNSKASEIDSAKSENNALNYANQASTSKDAAKISETNAKTSERNAANSATDAKNYASSWKGSLLPQGDITFSQLPTSGMIKGYMYCITNFFNTDSRFEEGANFFYPAGTCVYWTENNQWKCLSGVLSRKISQADYDALSSAQKNNGTIYYIEDGDNSMKVVTSSIDGLMSHQDKIKLDGIESGANKTIVDNTLSSTSTNPIQNKVINTALNNKSNTNHNHDDKYQAKGSYASSSHTHDDRYYTESEINTKLKNKAESVVLATNVDLNSVTTPGIYSCGGSNTITNKPSGIDAIGLIVVHNASGAYYTQILTNSTNTNTYRRTCNNGTWSAWSQDKYSDTNTWRGIQNNLTSDSTTDSLSAAQGKTLKGLIDGKAASSHTHTNLDTLGRVAYIGSDTANTDGWYKVYSASISEYNDHVARLSFVQGYGNINFGILVLHLRRENDTAVSVKKIGWETRTGFNANDAIIVTESNTWTLYIKQNCSRYGRIKVRVLESMGTSSNMDMILTDNSTKEPTAPTATAIATDCATVNYANSAGKINGHTVNSDVPTNAKFTDTTYSDFVGCSVSSKGKSGLVPTPIAGKQNAYLKGDGTWDVPTVSGGYPIKVITQAEYDTLSTKETDTIYMIKDAPEIKYGLTRFQILTQTQYDNLSKIEDDIIYFITD